MKVLIVGNNHTATETHHLMRDSFEYEGQVLIADTMPNEETFERVDFDLEIQQPLNRHDQRKWNKLNRKRKGEDR